MATTDSVQKQKSDTSDVIDLQKKLLNSLKSTTDEYVKINEIIDKVKEATGLYKKEVDKVSVAEKNLSDLLSKQIKDNTEHFINEKSYSKDKAKILSDIAKKEEEIEGELSKGINWNPLITNTLKDQLKKLKDQKDEMMEAQKLKRAEFIQNKIKNKEEIQQAKDKLQQEMKMDRLRGMANAVLTKSGDLLGDQGKKVFDLAKGWVDVAKTGNPYLIALKVMSDLIMLSIDRFIELQKAGEDFRNTTKLNVDQTKQLDKVALKLNQDYQQFGVSIKDAYDAAGDLMEELGNVKVLDNNKKLVETTVLLSKNLGVSSKEGAKFLTQTMSLSGVSSNVAASYASYAGNLAKAAGVPLNKLMKEVASASDETLAMVRGSTLELIKASASALRLGTNLNTVAKSARGMLNFQSSVTDEMEASVLVGKQLNFMESRRLAYAGDIEGAAKATLNTIKSAGEFQKMNVFQQEAVAKAAGISVGEINKMLMMEKQLAQLSPEQREEYERLTKLSKEKVELTGQDLLKQAKMQSVLTNINNNFGKMVQILSDKLLAVELFAKVLEFVTGLLANGGFQLALMGAGLFQFSSHVMKLLSKFEKMREWGNSIKSFFKPLVDWMTKIGDKIMSPFIWIEKKITALSRLKSIGGFFKPILGFLKIGKLGLKAVPILGEIVMGIELAMSLWKRFSDLRNTDEWKNAGFGESIVLGLKAIGGALYDVFIQPFVDIWDWLKEKFMGNSPSELGLRIVEGIKSVGSMLFDVLTSPFKMMWDFVKELFPNVADFLVSSFKKGLDFIMKIPGVSWALEKVGVKMPVTNAVGSTTSEKENKVENVVDTNAQILSKLDELINLMKSGGIAVNIDGRRASELLAQASSY